MDRFIIGPFRGLYKNVNEQAVPEANATSQLNATVRDGKLSPRNGISTLDSTPTGFATSYGFSLIRGYDDSYTEQEEYISFEKRSSTIKPYSVGVGTGYRQQITNGGTTLSLDAGTWRTVHMKGSSYSFIVGAGTNVYKHDVGILTSWNNLSALTPDDPTIAPTVQFLGTGQTEATVGLGTAWTWTTNVPSAYVFETPPIDAITRITGDKLQIQHGITTTANLTGIATVNLVTYGYGTENITSLAHFDFTLDENNGPYDWSLDYDNVTAYLVSAGGTSIQCDTTYVTDVDDNHFFTATPNVGYTTAHLSEITRVAVAYGITTNTGSPSGDFDIDLGSISVFTTSDAPGYGSQVDEDDDAYELVAERQYPNEMDDDPNGQITTGGTSFSKIYSNSPGRDLRLGTWHSYNQTNRAASFTMDWSNITGIGNSDWSDFGRIRYSIFRRSYVFSDPNSYASSHVTVDPSSIQVTIINASGTEIPTTVEVLETGDEYQITATFTDANQTDLETMDRIRTNYNYTTPGGTGSNTFILTWGVISIYSRPGSSSFDLSGMTKVNWAYDWYNSSSDLASEPIRSTQFLMKATQIWGEQVGLTTTYLGYAPTIGIPTSYPESADKWRLLIYWDDERIYRVFNTYDVSTTSVLVNETYDTLRNLSIRQTIEREIVSDVINAFPYKSWMVWLRRGGYQNIWHSAQDTPEILYSESESTEVTTRGAVQTMAQNFADEPVCGHQCGDSAVFLGREAAYANRGNSPIEMSPTIQLQKSVGTFGPFASTTWKTEQGYPSVLYLSRDGNNVLQIIVVDGAQGEYAYNVVEFSRDVQTYIKEWLFGGDISGVNRNQVELFVDDIDDAVWIVYGNRALVNRRRSSVSETRNWEPYEYAGQGFAHVEASPVHGVRAVGYDGAIYDIEYDSQAGFATIEGTYRDAGREMPVGHWRSKKFYGTPNAGSGNSRIKRVFVNREDLDDTPSVTVTSTYGVSTVSPAAGKVWVGVGNSQQGNNHQFEIEVSESQSPIIGFEAISYRAGERWIR